jgi:hypothetical protein
MASSVLAPWANFYILVGSSAAALTGLMFVVITLISGGERTQHSEFGVSMFTTPTVVHLGGALLVSAILSAPWHVLVHPAVLIGLAGLYGAVYVVHVAYRAARRRAAYQPDAEDRIWYQVLPFLAYAAFVAGAVALPRAPIEALFALAAGVLLLIFIGIHNAWDIVTFIVIKDGAQALAPASSEKVGLPESSPKDDAPASAPRIAASAEDEPVRPASP